MALSFDQVRSEANGLWKSKIFPDLRIYVPASKNKHDSCPICARNPSYTTSGKAPTKASNVDRFRCDDQKGDGSWICNICGAGDGFELVGRTRGWDKKQVLIEVGAILGLTGDGKTTDADRKKWEKEADDRRKQQELDEIRGNEAAAKKAKMTWSRLQSVDRDCPYIERKQVENHGCKINGKGNLVVPLFDIDGNIWNLQEIHADGYKPYLFGGRVNDCFFLIGQVTDPNQIICFVEGYATGASVFEATGRTTVVTFQSSNIDKVAKQFRKKYPDAQFVFCADDDSHSNPPDAGLKAANKALAATGGIVILPNFVTVESV